MRKKGTNTGKVIVKREYVCMRMGVCESVSVLIKTEREGEKEKKGLGERILHARQQGFSDEEVKGLSSFLKTFPIHPSLLPHCFLLIAIVQYCKFPLSAHSL